MVNPAKEKPLPLRFLCSDAFWEDSGVVPTSGLFHFTADISGRHAALTIDNCSLTNLVSVEVVEKLQLHTYSKAFPYLLATCDHALQVTQHTLVPLTIYGHTEYIRCDVVSRAFNFCHLMLGRHWCDQFQVVFDSGCPDPSIC
jgi:hypothetical protein